MNIKKEKLINLIEPFIYDKLDKCEYEIKTINAKELLTWNRFIIAFNLFYLDMFDKNKELAELVYTEMIRAASLGTFIEHGKEDEKNNLKSFFDEFHKTFENIKNNGFDKNKTIIPLASDGSILNGSHRVASAIYLNKDVDCIDCNIERIVDNYKNLYLRNISKNILDITAMKFIEYSDNVHLAFLWPSGIGYKKEAESKFSRIVYEKSLILSPTGGFNLLVELYKHMEWVGTINNGFSGAKQKLLECFPNFDPVKVIVFQADCLEDVQKIKEEVRKIYNIGYSSIHITDTKEEAIRISRLIFNKNALHFLNYSEPYKYMSQYKELDKFKEFISRNNINNEDVIIDGSFVLSLYGIRKSKDIDYMINDKKNIIYKDELFESHENQLIYHKEEKKDIIYNPDFYFYFNGMKIISFFQLYKMKKNRDEEKDKNDCQIMDAFLSNDKFKEFISKIEQNLFYFRIKIIHNSMQAIIKLLRLTKLYVPARMIYRKLKKIKYWNS